MVVCVSFEQVLLRSNFTWCKEFQFPWKLPISCRWAAIGDIWWSLRRWQQANKQSLPPSWTTEIYLYRASRLVPLWGIEVSFPVSKLRSDTGSSRRCFPVAISFHKFVSDESSADARGPWELSVCIWTPKWTCHPHWTYPSISSSWVDFCCFLFEANETSNMHLSNNIEVTRTLKGERESGRGGQFSQVHNILSNSSRLQRTPSEFHIVYVECAEFFHTGHYNIYNIEFKHRNHGSLPPILRGILPSFLTA